MAEQTGLPDAIREYHEKLEPAYAQIGEKLAALIAAHLPESEGKVWHGHPVWFIEGNPLTGYNMQKNGLQLLFWSGQDFSETELLPLGKFKAASKIYTDIKEVDENKLKIWLEKSRDIQWDYKNIVRRKGKLERLK